MPHKRSNTQRNFQCDFCPTRNSWVKYILVGKDKHHICPECIAELTRQIRKEKETKDARTNPIGGIGDQPLQTETPQDAN